MDVNEKPVKSCAIKVHLANVINRKSHVTLVVPELCSGFTIKAIATKKIGMNEKHVNATELFVSVRDNFKTISADENDGSNLFHVLDSDSPGQFVNLRFCEFHLYWKESLPQALEQSVNISEFRSRASMEEKLISVMNTKLSSGHAQRNGSLKTANLSQGISGPTSTNMQMTSKTQPMGHTLEAKIKMDRKVSNKETSILNNTVKNVSNKKEVNSIKDENAVGNYNITNEIRGRRSLSSVRSQVKGLKKETDIQKDAMPPKKDEVLNSPCSSYSSSSVELKHNLSASMPVLNKVIKKDFHKNKNPLMSKIVNSKSNISDSQCNSVTNERLSTSRRQLPQVAISEEVVEEKRHLLSKQLEKRLIRRATMNESSGKRPIHKTQSLHGWKERFKSCNEDSDDSRSLASQEVAEIMADAGPMGIIESDYEEPDSHNDEDETSEDGRLDGKNVFMSLFDSMTSDPIEEGSDDSSSSLNASSSERLKRVLTDESKIEFSNKNLPPKSEFHSSKSSFTLYSHIRPDLRRSLESCQNKLTLFDLLKPGILKLFPVSAHLIKSSKDLNSKRELPFKVYNDVIKLSSCDFRNNKFDEVTKSFDALKIGNLKNSGLQNRTQLRYRFSRECKSGDLLIEVNNTSVLGFTEAQFSELESSVLTKCDIIHMVVARPS